MIQRGTRPSWGMFAAETWVLFSAWCSLAGWGLSLCGRLDGPGYAAAFFAGSVLWIPWLRRAGIPRFAAPSLKCALTLWHKRFRKPLPFLFLAAAVLTLIGGALYAPSNYDALTYRLPRVFHWLADGRWHWIDTINDRMNYSGAGFEWLMAPLLLLTRSDRFLFLLNFLPWLLMPGACFACLREMGVRARVAWHWMWLLPLGDCYLLQAGGIGNDSYAALYLLLSIGLALRARRTHRAGDLWIAALAAALCTGSKASNLPLLLPFVIAAWPAGRLVFTHKTAAASVALACLALSFLPLAILNQRHTGGWTGDPGNTGKMELRNPAAGIAGNALELAVHNLEPPLLASALNGAANRITRTRFIQALKKDYPRLSLGAGELPQEEGAGAGIGLSLLFLISLAAWPLLRSAAGRNAASACGYRIAFGAWIALAVYMAKIGSEAAPRLVAAYYPLCFALALLHPGNSLLARRRWWRVAAVLAALSVFPALILNPGRPLWPALTILRALPSRLSQNAGIQRMDTVYEVYARRPRLFTPFVRQIPPGEHLIAFLGIGDDPSSSLWLPFGSRRVADLYPGNEDRVFGRRADTLLVASGASIASWYGEPAEQWIRERRARIIEQESLIVKIQRGPPEDWYLLDVPAPGAGPTKQAMPGVSHSY